MPGNFSSFLFERTGIRILSRVTLYGCQNTCQDHSSREATCQASGTLRTSAEWKCLPLPASQPQFDIPAKRAAKVGISLRHAAASPAQKIMHEKGSCHFLTGEQ